MNGRPSTVRRLSVRVQRADARAGVPSAAFLEKCARAALPEAGGEIVIRVVDETESAGLNERFLGKAGATNVLAFPAGEVPGLASAMQPLGDIAVCAAIVGREADAQGKTLEAHWAHMTVHGCLHIAGFDHQTEAEAEAMEAHERAVLAELGFDDPYAARG